MMRSIHYIFILFFITTIVSCEEVNESTIYDHWKERNISFCDSIAELSKENYIAKMEQIDKLEVNEWFILWDIISSTAQENNYVYCKKLSSNPQGIRPLWLSAVNVFYYGTLINGDSFDGNFVGYSSMDQNIEFPLTKMPTPFDEPKQFILSSDYPYNLITGWCTILQYMRTGERWFVCIPYESAYGSSSSSDGIPGYSTLTFDIQLTDVVN